MRKVIQQLGIYKKDTYRCIGLTALEVIMEILMPFITAIIIDQGLEAKDLGVVYRFGGMMVVMAFLSLTFGGLAGKDAASAASGLAANLREAIYANIQTFSFSNIDKCVHDGDPCGGAGAAEPDLQFHHVPDHQPPLERNVPDRSGLPGDRDRSYHGGNA